MATRRCVARLKDMTSEEIVDFFMTVCKCQRLLEEYYQTTSSTVTVQDGEFAGQTVRVRLQEKSGRFAQWLKDSLSHFSHLARSLPCDAT